MCPIADLRRLSGRTRGGCPGAGSRRSLIGVRAGLCEPVDVVTEGDMKASQWNAVIQALVLVRLGQELGTDSPLARALAEVVRVVFTVGR